MNQYIDKTAVVKVIENRIREIQELLEKNEKKLDSNEKTTALFCIDELIMILSLIDALEVKNKQQTMIKERYCSFEVAKLLKEKGFDVPCIGRYSIHFKEFHLDCTRLCNNGGLFAYASPTHQMAMDWLREEYKIAIDIRITCEKTISYAFDIWDFEIIHPNKFVGGTIDLREQQFGFKSYEDAVEAALKYVLENLI